MPSSTWVDPGTRVTEITEFFEGPQDVLFGCTYIPPQAPVGAVLVCSSLEIESVHSHRLEVLLARHLARRGVTVQRFHYRGAGHSRGEASRSTLETMRADAGAALRRLCQRAASDSLGVVGIRFGALVAAGALGFERPRPIALWQPVLQTSAYFRELLRIKRMQELRWGRQTQSPEEVADVLSQQGFVDVLGWPFYRSLYDETASLTDELGREPQHLLLVEFGSSGDLSGPNRVAIECWRERAHIVDTCMIAGKRDWWFGNTPPPPEESRPEVRPALDATAHWFQYALAHRCECPLPS